MVSAPRPRWLPWLLALLLALSGLPHPGALAAGEGTVVGYVYEQETGAPLEGITVSAGGRQAQTDGLGYYRLEGLPQAPTTVSVPGQSAQVQVGAWTRQDFPLSGRPPGQTHTLTGMAMDINTGEPLPGVQVTAAGGGKTVSATTAPDGTYALEGVPTGNATVTMSLAGYNSGTAALAVTGPSVANGFLKLANPGRIEGTVRGLRLGELRPVTGALVYLEGKKEMGLKRAVLGFLGPELELTDAGGKFAYADLPGGKYTLTIMAAGFADLVREVVYDPRQGPPAPLDLVLTPRAATLEISLKAAAYGGAPLPGVKVRLQGEPNSDVADVTAEKESDGAGRVVWTDVPPGPYRLTAGPDVRTSRGPEPLLGTHTRALTAKEDLVAVVDWDLPVALGELTASLATVSDRALELRQPPTEQVLTRQYEEQHLMPHTTPPPCVAGSGQVTLWPSHYQWNALCLDPGVPGAPGTSPPAAHPLRLDRVPLPAGTRVRIIAARLPGVGQVDKRSIYLGGQPVGQGPVMEALPVDVPLEEGVFSGLLPPGDYTLEITGPDFDRQTVELQVSPGEQPRQDLLVAPRYGTVAGRAVHVLWHDLHDWEQNRNIWPYALRGAQVTLRGPGGTFTASTNAAGLFSIAKVPAGDYTLEVKHALAAETYPLQVQGGGAVNLVHRVVKSTLAQSLGVRSIVRTIGEDSASYRFGDLTFLHPNAAAMTSVYISASRMPSAVLMPAGNYQIYFGTEFCGPVGMPWAAGTAPTLEHTTGLPKDTGLPAQCSLPVPAALQYVGYVLDQAGAPVPGARVQVQATFEACSGNYCGRPAEAAPVRQGEAVTDGEGRFQVQVPFGLGPRYFEREHRLTVQADGFKPLTVVRPAFVPGAHAMDLVLEPATTLKGAAQNAGGGAPPKHLQVWVDGVPAPVEGEAPPVYSLTIPAGSAPRQAAVRSEARGFFPFQVEVTIPPAAAGQGQVITQDLAMKPIPKPSARKAQDDFLVSVADDRPLRGVVLAGFDHVPYQGITAGTPYTRVRWEIRAQRGPLPQGFNDPIHAVYLRVEGRPCGDEETGRTMTARFQGVPKREMDNQNSGVWGGELDAALELPCSDLRFTAETVTRAGARGEDPLEWNLWPTAGAGPLYYLTQFYTNLRLDLTQLKGTYRTKPATPGQPAGRLRQVSATTGDLRVDRDPGSAAGLCYTYGPIELGATFNGKLDFFLTRWVGLADMAPGLKAEMKEFRACGLSGRYTVDLKGFATFDKWTARYTDWLKALDQGPPVVPRPKFERIKIDFSDGIQGRDMPMAPGARFTAEKGGGKLWETLGGGTSLQFRINLPLPPQFIWLSTLMARFGIEPPSLLLIPELRGDFGNEVELKTKLLTNVLLPFQIIRHLDDEHARLWEFNGKFLANLAVGKEGEKIRVEGGPVGKVKYVVDPAPISSSKAFEIKGYLRLLVGLPWLEREFRTDDYFFVHWKRGTESLVSAASSVQRLNFVSLATPGAGGGAAGAGRGLTDQGNSASAVDRQGRTVLLRTLGGGTAAYPNNFQMEYLLREPGASAWSAPRPVGAPSAGPAREVAAVRLPDGRVLAVWSALTQPLRRPYDALLAFRSQRLVWSAWDGSTWSAPAPVAAAEHAQAQPALAAGADGSVALAWVADMDGYPITVDDTEVRLAAWTGTGFGPAQTAVGGARALSAPSLSLAGRRATVAYVRQSGPRADQDMTARQVVVAQGQGAVWSAPQPVPAPAGTKPAAQALPLAVSEGAGARVYWVQPGTDTDGAPVEVLYTAVRQGGGWSPPAEVAREAEVYSVAALPPVGGQAAVAWTASLGGDSALRARVLQPGGAGPVLSLAQLPGRAQDLTAAPGEGARPYVFAYVSKGADGKASLDAAGLGLVDRPLGGTEIRLAIDQQDAFINGERKPLDVPPAILNGRTMVPVRFISEALGAQVAWDGATRTVTITDRETVITMQLDNPTARVNGRPVALDVPPAIINGRTLVPVRFVAESLGLKVGWDPQTRTVTLSR